MGIQVEITCDHCAGDLTYSFNSVDYRLVLDNEFIPSREGEAVTDMMIYPPIDKKHIFCGMGCLEKWMNKRK